MDSLKKSWNDTESCTRTTIIIIIAVVIILIILLIWRKALTSNKNKKEEASPSSSAISFSDSDADIVDSRQKVHTPTQAPATIPNPESEKSTPLVETPRPSVGNRSRPRRNRSSVEKVHPPVDPATAEKMKEARSKALAKQKLAAASQNENPSDVNDGDDQESSPAQKSTRRFLSKNDLG